MSIFLLFLFFPFIYGKLRSDIASCSHSFNPTAVDLNSNEVIYFESENYPSSNYGCQQNFNRLDGEMTGFIFILTNGLVDVFQLIPNPVPTTDEPIPTVNQFPPTFTPDFDASKGLVYNSIVDADSVLFQKPGSYYSEWTAFQGVVYAPPVNPVSSCLLTGQVLNLTDSKRIIPLVSFGNITESEDCIWEIIIPKSMGLKVVVREKLSTESLTISADNGALNSLENNTAYNFRGTAFTLTYKKRILSPNQTVSIAVLISATFFFPENNVQCYSNFSDGSGIFQLEDDAQGYPNNTICEATLLSQPGKSIYLSVSSVVESVADKIILKDTRGNICSLNGKRKVALSSNDNYTFHFESDGNTNAVGFLIQKLDFDCTCIQTKKIVSCDNYAFGLNIVDSYCNSMNCEFDVVLNQSCPQRFFFLGAQTQFRDGNIDSLEIFVDGKSIYNTSSSKLNNFGRLFLRNETIHMKFKSGNDPMDINKEAPQLHFPTIINNSSTILTLSPESPVFRSPIDTGDNNDFCLTVRAPVNYTLDLFFDSLIHDSDLYDGDILFETLNDPLDQGDSGYLTPYTSKTGQFTVVQTNYYFASYFFRLREIHAKNCLDKNNVIQIDYEPVNLTLYNEVEDKCLMTFLLGRYSYDQMRLIFNDVSLSSDVTFYAGTDFNHPIITVNETSAEYTSVPILGSYFSVLMPGKSWMNINTTQSPYSDFSRSVVYPLIYDDPAFFSNKKVHFDFSAEFNETIGLQVRYLDLGEKDSLILHVSDNENQT